MTRRSLAIIRVIAGGLAIAGFGIGTAGAQVDAPSIEAAFVFNFARYAEWPRDAVPVDAPLLLCVIGDDVVADELERMARENRAAGRDLALVRKKPDDSVHDCHLLYLSGQGEKRSARLLERLKEAPVLTISDHERFAEKGGIAQLYLEQGRMRFAVNLRAARRARLQLSSKLLGLARIVDDDRSK